jgi:hypothetical protein
LAYTLLFVAEGLAKISLRGEADFGGRSSTVELQDVAKTGSTSLPLRLILDIMGVYASLEMQDL